MTQSPNTTRTISHAEARDVARRLIAGSFGRDGERQSYDVGPRFSIPTRPDYDDDCLIVAYIEQQEAADLVGAHVEEAARFAYADVPDVRRDLAAPQVIHIPEQLAQMERRHRQREELPLLPPVGGYGVRHEGHYSAQQMRDYASAALAAERSS
ncbi:hypothetical protein [Aureimonas sp. SK2]|uniref:hypothetical protein n=1 Tax=Aureimonas sp. SK2 TaxID=3015992 RepID=UPI0024450313|nr:hypothetical protein [Aureimonas sp. SK2]